MALTMTTTFEPFPHLPCELQLEIFRHAMEEEDQARILVVWHDRLIPFKGLVSPLLSVNKLSRNTAQSRYTTKIDIFAADFDCAAPCPRSSEVTSVFNYLLGTHVAGRRPRGQGVLYLNPAHNIILYGYNCIHDFFGDMREPMAEVDSGQGLYPRLSVSNPVLRHCSATLPDTFFHCLEKDPRRSKFLLIDDDETEIESQNLASRFILWNGLSEYKRILRYDDADNEPIPAFQTLRLTQQESYGLMAYLSASSDGVLPGYVEGWVDKRLGRLQKPTHVSDYFLHYGSLRSVLNNVIMDVESEEDRYKRVQLAAAKEHAGKEGRDHGAQNIISEQEAGEQDGQDLALPVTLVADKYIDPHGADSLESISKRLDLLKQKQADLEVMEHNIMQFKTMRNGERRRQ